ncbi:GNAT family N-acetyltransferase [Aquamicrobium sp. LC103]|uniref:GNAT family N-acetyltransferase n=1 Tax=Aquamicrobium sp. LC103 TaxID=1120658 RepID=UPI00069C150B|nr:GNAT family N-acetyltransferase [Aquamicrobium sp. LC103]TKT69904.1 GNAT family N-acetyltransferase [Aquamicrobium sp. LC103]
MIGSSTFSLRPAEAPDAPFLREMFVGARERELGGLSPEIRDGMAEQQYRIHQKGLGAAYPDARHLIVLAASGASGELEKPVGVITLANRPGELWIVDMALHPAHRNAGLGTALLESLMEDCRRDCMTMRGSVTPYNPARRLYARLGIREIGTESRGYIALEWRPQ